MANFNKCCKKFSIGPKGVTKYSYLFREEVLPKTKVINKMPATAKKPMANVTNNKPKAKVMKGRKTKTAKKLAARKTPVIKAITKKPATKVTKTPATKR